MNYFIKIGDWTNSLGVSRLKRNIAYVQKWFSATNMS